MLHSFAFVLSLPFFMMSIVRFWHPDLLVTVHDGQPFAIGRFGRTLVLAISLVIWVACVIGAYAFVHNFGSSSARGSR